MKQDSERSLAEASYQLANRIMEEYQDECFYYEDEGDMIEVRKINAISDLLEQLGDDRYDELRTRVHSMIKYPKEFPKDLEELIRRNLK